MVREMELLEAARIAAQEQRNQLMRELLFSYPGLSLAESYAQDTYSNGINLPQELLPSERTIRKSKRISGSRTMTGVSGARERRDGQKREMDDDLGEVGKYSEIEGSGDHSSSQVSEKNSPSASSPTSRSSSRAASEPIDDYQVDYEDEEADISDKIGGND